MRKLSKIISLDESFKIVLMEEKQGKKLIPDCLCFCDQETQQNNIFLDNLKKYLDNGTYKAGPLLTMDVPRNNFCIRPAAVPTLEDWIVYDAFARYIGRLANNKLEPTVFS